jgi:hypothetical protein
VRDLATGAECLLTAAHVVGSLSQAYGTGRTDVLLANGTLAAGGDPTIGNVVLSHPSEPCDEIMFDAALVAPSPGVTLTSTVRNRVVSCLARDVEETAMEDNPVIVYKRGINQPSLTMGLLDPVPTSLEVKSCLPDGSEVSRFYPRGYFVVGDDRPFARPGDSGSIVVDEDSCVVGLLVALRATSPNDVQADDPGFVVPIVDLLDEIGVELIGPSRACTVV